MIRSEAKPSLTWQYSHPHCLRLFYYCLCLALSLCGDVYGIEIEGLYKAEIMVMSQTDEDRKTAATLALQDVLMRVSGRNINKDNPVISAALAKPRFYYTEYSYSSTEKKVQTKRDALIGLTATEETIITAYNISFRFDQNAVNELLKKAGLPIWSSNRPGVMTWLVVENQQGDREVLSAESDNELTESLRIQADKRGLPIVLPLMDLDDQMAVDITPLWGLFPEHIQQISARYRLPGILVGRLYQTKQSEWMATWLFIFNGQELRFSFLANELNDVFAAAMEQAGNKLAENFAIDSEVINADIIHFQVNAIDTFVDYARVSTYLENMLQIQKVNVLKIVNDKVLFSVIFEGEMGQLIQSVGLNQDFTELQKPALMDEGITCLFYTWTP